MKVVCKGDLDPTLSWVVDYAEISKAMEPILTVLDHKNVDDVILIPSTAENLAFWIYESLRKTLKFLDSVEVSETESTNVIYKP